MHTIVKKMATVIISSFLLFTLGGCADWNPDKSVWGAGGGAAGGALIGQAIGHNTEATLIGAAVGTMLGYMIGNEMDKYDRQQLNHVYERGESGVTKQWNNPDKGHRYQVTPQPAYSNPRTRQPCRQAEIQSVINGKRETVYSTACRDSSGRWQLQN